MPFQKGQSGNPEGKRTNKPFWSAIDKAIAQDDGERLRRAAEHLLDAAAEGKPWALKEIADRLDGRPANSVEMSGSIGIGLVGLLGSIGKPSPADRP